MGIEQIHTAVLAAGIDGIIERGANLVDALELNYLKSFVARARRQHDAVWNKMSTREVQYLNDILLTAYNRGGIDHDSIIAQELGVPRYEAYKARKKKKAEEEKNKQHLKEMMSETSERRAKDKNGESQPTDKIVAILDDEEADASASEAAESKKDSQRPKSPRDKVVAGLRSYLLALIDQDSLIGQQAWRDQEEASEDMNPRLLGYLRLLAINKTMEALPDHLINLDAILLDKTMDETDRLRHLFRYAFSMRKFSQIQIQLLEEVLLALPDPDGTHATVQFKAFRNPEASSSS